MIPHALIIDTIIRELGELISELLTRMGNFFYDKITNIAYYFYDYFPPWIAPVAFTVIGGAILGVLFTLKKIWELL